MQVYVSLIVKRKKLVQQISFFKNKDMEFSKTRTERKEKEA